MTLEVADNPCPFNGEMVPGPRWVEGNECGCQHNPEDFVCSFVASNKGEGKVYDLYLFESGDGQDVCIRCSNEASDYLSPGRVVHFLCSAAYFGAKAPTYDAAAKIIKEHFDIRATKKEVKA